MKADREARGEASATDRMVAVFQDLYDVSRKNGAYGTAAVAADRLARIEGVYKDKLDVRAQVAVAHVAVAAGGASLDIVADLSDSLLDELEQRADELAKKGQLQITDGEAVAPVAQAAIAEAVVVSEESDDDVEE